MNQKIVLGQVSGLHGLAGWLKVHSFTRPREQLLDYPALQLGDLGKRSIKGQRSGQRILLRVSGVDDRTDAEALVGMELWLDRAELPQLEGSEYYWCDLEGCRVVNRSGDDFGTVSHILATGAHDVLVVKGEQERLIPFVPEHYILDVDLQARQIQVDWEADY